MNGNPHVVVRAILTKFGVMENETFDINSLLIRNILANNEFGITAVKKIQEIKSGYFIREQYLEIENIIKSKDIDAVKNLPKINLNTHEYLIIALFKDQNDKSFIATFYDNDNLEQEPQLIKIYPL